ncbi:MAG: molybdopterin dinucleotide binding domain-containing protein, partial [Dehalococcoidia bacterium]|nr:molybdopterin dinucleotide binding domain-containing protein [Dehalococcoidia bacterium]
RDIVAQVPGYPTYEAIAGNPGDTRVVTESGLTARAGTVSAAPARVDGFALITGRSLYTSWEGASTRSEEADKLHREEAAWVNPRDAEAAGIRAGDVVELAGNGVTVRIAARLDDGVAPGTIYVPHYYDAGAVMGLWSLQGQAGGLAAVRVRALQPA